MGAYILQNTQLAMNSNPQVWPAEEVDLIEAALSIDRFGRYLDAASAKPEALAYYRWNVALSSAFYGPLQCLEVGLRNAVHHRLATTHGDAWYQLPTLLSGRDQATARDAADKVSRSGKPVTPGRIVAELSFGFWVGLFSNAYDQSIWRTDLYRLFSPRPQRKDLHEKLDKLRTLRNRIAHHEPIFQRRLMDDYARLCEVLRSLSPELCSWSEHHSRVYDVLADGPNGVDRF